MKVSFLLLDYNRPEESKICLDSIRQNAKIDYDIIFLDNGSDEKYAREYKKDGLIDVLLENESNVGCGYGTEQLFRSCKTDYAFYVQVDQALQLTIDESLLKYWIDVVLKGNGNKVIDLSGVGNGRYSERAHLADVKWYNDIPNKPHGGPGPYEHLQWNEGYVQDYLEANGNPVLRWDLVFFLDNGKITMRENPDGSRWRQRCDTKELWMLEPPTERFCYPPFDDAEWEYVLENKLWPDGKIPRRVERDSFQYWS